MEPEGSALGARRPGFGARASASEGPGARGSAVEARRSRSGVRASGGQLSHMDAQGRVRMVDVSDKAATPREAVARGRIAMSREAVRRIRAGEVSKGDPLQVARLAGIMAAKRTSDLIPLCHPLPLSHADVALVPVRDGYTIEARVRTTAQTGVEMEALTAVTVAALTIYDMVKAVDKAMIISEIRLVEKRGGRSGDYHA